ncbi:hypothetical protein [Psychrobacillus antarcticus]|uniref:hypothetical protein n=1 Tax=Psychrobacillus antarcticus TaxID=2879115 RepID=UPI0024080222|nr:hypothetical protein [Psychrobacillus antarcticus]
MLTDVTDGIHKLVIKFPEGMGEVNCYLIEGKNGYTVIDTATDSIESNAEGRLFLFYKENNPLIILTTPVKKQLNLFLYWIFFV